MIKNIFITGGTSEIGKSLIHKLAKNNYNIFFTYFNNLSEAKSISKDLQKLNILVRSRIVDVMDHSQIEKDIDWFKGKQPSSENILLWAWEEIASRLQQGTLYRLRLVETHSIHTDYYGPEKNEI